MITVTSSLFTVHCSLLPDPRMARGLCSRMDATRRPSQELINAQKELARRRQLAGVSVPVANAECRVRNAAAVPSSQLTVDSEQCSAGSDQLPRPNPQSATCAERSRSIRISPTLAAHCLNREHRHNNAQLDGPYRLYKILQALDRDGRGWLANREVEPLLTGKDSPLFIFGRRQLKIMLRRGEGLFWNRVKGEGEMRIRLVGRRKLTMALGAGRLRGREVELPLAHLLGSGRGRQAQVNAAFYTAVHAGRLRPDRSRSGQPKPRPISRATLRQLSGCSRYRQRRYEQRMHIEVQANIHIMGAHSDYRLQRARQHLHLPAYQHIDYRGRINRHRQGAAYIAVRLPNSYHLPDGFTAVQSRRQRTINRLLDGLCHMGSGGSGEDSIERLYHRDAAQAIRASFDSRVKPSYWPLLGKGKTRLWQNAAEQGDEQVGHRTGNGRAFSPGNPSRTVAAKGGDLN